MDRSFNEVEFGARLADEVPEFADLDSVPGVDGFSLSVDPLYKVSFMFTKKTYFKQILKFCLILQLIREPFFTIKIYIVL